MQLVDEQDDIARLLNFLNAFLQALFEFTTVLGACHQSRYIKCDDAHIANDIGYLIGNDKLSQTFGNSGFAHTGFTDKQRVVLLATREDLHHTLDFASAPDYGIELAILGLFGEVDAKFLQHAVGSTRVGIEIGSAREHRRLAHHIIQGRANGIAFHPELAQYVNRCAFAFADNAQQQMLGRDIAFAHLHGFTQ